MLRVLRSRNVTLLWLGQLISVIGDWLLFIGLPFAVYERTGSTLAAGALFVVEVVPQVVLGSVAGVLVDRWDRRRTMIAADLARALVLLPLLGIGGDGWLWLVYPAAFFQAGFSQFFLPARSALLPRLVGGGDLAAANGLMELGDELAFTVGAAVGGTLLALIALSALVLIDVASYLLSALCILLVAVPMANIDAVNEAPSSGGSPWRGALNDWRGGIGLVRSHRAVAAVFAATGVATLAEGLIVVLLVPFVEEVLDKGAREFGWLAAARGIGGILGGVVIGYAARKLPLFYLIALAGGLDGVALLVLFNVSAMPLLLLMMVIAGVAVVNFYVAQQTLLQHTVVHTHLGRVFGTYAALRGLVLLIGMAFAAGFAETVGVRPLLIVAGALYLVAGALAALLMSWAGGTSKIDIPPEFPSTPMTP